MKVQEIMSNNPACCTRETSLQDVAVLMVEHDCGEIPVVDNTQSKRPVGVITDRLDDVHVTVVSPVPVVGRVRWPRTSSMFGTDNASAAVFTTDSAALAGTGTSAAATATTTPRRRRDNNIVVVCLPR